MAKFYVQSGSVRFVIDMEDAERASCWFVHRAMEPIAHLYDDANVSYEQKEEMAMLEAILSLDDSIAISELGFDRDDADRVPTVETVRYWHQMMVALDRLEKLL